MGDFPIIIKLGGREAVFQSLSSHGCAPKSLDTMRMWTARGRLPGDWQTELMLLAEAANIEYTSSDFFITEPQEAAQ